MSTILKVPKKMSSRKSFIGLQISFYLIFRGKPTWIIYGEENDELKEAGKAFPSLKLFKIKSPFPYGHHHT